MSQKAAKTIIYAALLLSACGCLAFAVAVGGIAVYNLLNYDLRLSDTEIGIDLGRVPGAPPVEQWFKPSTGTGAEAPQAENPPSGQSGQPQPVGSPESAYTEEAQKECAAFGAAFPQLDLIMAWKSESELTCGFGQQGSQKYSGLVGIEQYGSTQQAAETWAKEWGPESDYVGAVSKYAEGDSARYTYNHEGERFFLAYRDYVEGETPKYVITAGRLYANSIVRFEDNTSTSNATATWEMAEGLAMDWVDENNE